MVKLVGNNFENNSGFFFSNVIFIQVFAVSTTQDENWSQCGGIFK